VELVSLVHRGKPTNVVISTGKDGFLKLWDADTRLCLSVISTQTTEALSFAYSPERSLIYVGTNKEDIALVSIH
jgi:WD40 repeat protein